jgi:hypothetical protein
MKFVSMLLFLFDVGITPHAGPEPENRIDHVNIRFDLSAAFTSPSKFRNRQLKIPSFRIYLEVCAWNVFTVSAMRSPTQVIRLAIPNVCRELCTRISAVKDQCLAAENRQGFLDNWEQPRSTSLRRIERAITGILEWRHIWESQNAVSMLQAYQAALAELQVEYAISLAQTSTSQRETETETETSHHSLGPNSSAAACDMQKMLCLLGALGVKRD